MNLISARSISLDSTFKLPKQTKKPPDPEYTYFKIAAYDMFEGAGVEF
jgi:hypothetical protein